MSVLKFKSTSVMVTVVSVILCVIIIVSSRPIAAVRVVPTGRLFQYIGNAVWF